MAAPVVKELFMDRYGASPSMAQMFNGINLFGAFAALPLLWFVRGKNHSVALVIWGSLADAFLLAVMALPLGLEWTLVVRALEGVTDVIVFAALFDLVRRSSRGHVGAGMGIASSPLLMGLGFGAMLGGLVVRQSAEGVSANFQLCRRAIQQDPFQAPLIRAVIPPTIHARAVNIQKLAITRSAVFL